MRVHFLTHADFEQPGYYLTWARENGFSVSQTAVYNDETLPETDDYDLLIIMGGPQSPAETDKYPYLSTELDHIRTAIKNNKYIIGVCLGAQLIAEAFGSKTQASPHKEIGVYPLTLTDKGKQDLLCKDLPTSFQSGHWHNDMPGLPSGAIILAESAGCPRQIIKFTQKIIGFQCHLEFDKNCVETLITHCQNDLSDGNFVQSADVILSQNYDKINVHLKLFLKNFIII